MSSAMKIGYVGGGSLRVLQEVRALTGLQGVMNGCEIALFDHDEVRIKAMANLLRKAPEVKQAGARVVVASSLDQAIEGADFVEITACPWSGRYFGNCATAAHRNGFVSSDNVSLTGAFLAMKSAGLALNVARRMETLAPDGTLVCFTNPVALLSGAVNRNTKIRAIGICAGQANYVHNVAYIMGWPTQDWDLEAEAAGINHISWFMALSLHGKDLMPEFTKKLETGIDYDKLKQIGNYNELCRQFPRMIYAWKKFGVIHYSIEPEGLPILSFYEEDLDQQRPSSMPAAQAPKPQVVAENPPARPRHIEEFLRLASSDITPEQWDGKGPDLLKQHPFKAYTGARVIKGLATDSPETLAVSYFNRGSIEGFADDDIMEFSMRFVSGRVEKHATYRLPPVVNGLTHMLVEHQMLVADAIAQEDPDLFLKGIYAYPLCRSRRVVEAFLSEVVETNRDELPEFIRKASW